MKTYSYTLVNESNYIHLVQTVVEHRTLSNIVTIKKGPSKPLKIHQKNVLLESSSFNFFLLFWAMGTGKTKASIHIVKSRKETSVYVACPVTCVKNWAKEIMKTHLTYDRIDFHILGYDELKKQCSGNKNLLSNSFVILDEVQVFRNLPKTFDLILDALSSPNIQKPIKGILALTGTPIISPSDNLDYLFTLKSYTLDKNKDLKVHFYDPKHYLYSSYQDKEKQEIPNAIHLDYKCIEMSLFQVLEYFMRQKQTLNIKDLSIVQGFRNSYNSKSKMICNFSTEIDSPGNKMKQILKDINVMINNEINLPIVVYGRLIDNGVLFLYNKIKLVTKKVALICGNTPNDIRSDIIRKYNSRQIDVLLISDACCTGINLKGTQNFIVTQISDQINMENQAIARTTRQGSHDSVLPPKKKEVTVHKYISCFPKKVKKKDITGSLYEYFSEKYKVKDLLSSKDFAEWFINKINNENSIEEQIINLRNKNLSFMDSKVQNLILKGFRPALKMEIDRKSISSKYSLKTL